MRINISQDEIKEWFEYRDGFLYWKKDNGTHGKRGNIAGGFRSKKHPYWLIGFKKKRHHAHRLIWIYFNGDIPDEMEIDHINKDKTDNRIENLRIVTHGQNGINKDCSKNNIYKIHKTKSGVIMYYARVRHNGERYFYKSSDMEDIKQWAENLKKNLLNTS